MKVFMLLAQRKQAADYGDNQFPPELLYAIDEGGSEDSILSKYDEYMRSGQFQSVVIISAHINDVDIIKALYPTCEINDIEPEVHRSFRA